MQCVSNGEDLKFLLQSKQCHGKLAKSSVGVYTIYTHLLYTKHIVKLKKRETVTVMFMIFF